MVFEITKDWDFVNGRNIYIIHYLDSIYGVMSEEGLKNKRVEDLLDLVGNMLNDGYELGLKKKEWVSMKEGSPQNDQLVLGMSKELTAPLILRFNVIDGNRYLFTCPHLKKQILNISHWMALPESPIPSNHLKEVVNDI